MKELTNMGMEEVENFKDAESMIIENKHKGSKNFRSKREDSKDEGSEETVLGQSGRKLAHIVRKEQVNKDIMMGLQRTIERIMGLGQKTVIVIGNNPPSKEGGSEPSSK